jgi:hypothetical protein
MSKLQTKFMLFIGLAAAALSPTLRADEWNQKTKLTFSGPVEVPGRVLEAGTYVFKLADSNSNRNIIQVFSGDEKQVYATFLAIPDVRATPSEKTIVTFSERPAGSPQAVKGWFYPGRTYGHEFVYPKAKAVELAHTWHTPVPAMPDKLMPEFIHLSVTLSAPEVATLESAPLIAEEPDGAEVEIEAAFTTTATAPSSDLPEELPETASQLPLIALLGATSLGIAFLLRRTARRSPQR